MSFTARESYIDTLGRLFQPLSGIPDISRMIVVAIDNDGMGRMNEYAVLEVSRISHPGQQFGGREWSMPSLSWKRSILFIDETYRTKADRQHTAMIGSSLEAILLSLSD